VAGHPDNSRSSSIIPPMSPHDHGHDCDQCQYPQSLSLSLSGPMTAAKAKLIQMMMLQQQHQQAASQSVSALASSLPMPPPDPPAIPPGQYMHEDINIVNVNDVLAGRGSTVSQHPGNIAFREFVGSFKLMYMDKFNKLSFKAHMCANIVDHVRTLEPPGRFLQKKPKPHTHNNDVWMEMGDEKARKKAGQALREDATVIRAERGMAQFHPRNKKGALVSAMLSDGGNSGSFNETTTKTTPVVAGADQQEQDIFLALQQYQQHDHDIAEASMDQQQQQFHTNHNNNYHIPLGMAISESRKSHITAEQQETNYFLTPYEDQYEYEHMAPQDLLQQQTQNGFASVLFAQSSQRNKMIQQQQLELVKGVAPGIKMEEQEQDIELEQDQKIRSHDFQMEKLFLAQQQFDVAKAASPGHNNKDTNDDHRQYLTLLQAIQHQQQFQHTNHNDNNHHLPLGMAIRESRKSIAAEQQETNYFLTPYQDQYEYMAPQEELLQQQTTQKDYHNDFASVLAQSSQRNKTIQPQQLQLVQGTAPGIKMEEQEQDIELEQDHKIAVHDRLEMEHRQDTATKTENENEMIKLKMRKKELFSQRSLSARSLARQHYQNQDASGGYVAATAAATASNDLGAASIQNHQAEADPSLFVEETTPPADEIVCANTDNTVTGARQHSLLTQSCTSWVETTARDQQHNKPHIKKNPSMQRLNLDTGGIIAEDDKDDEEEEEEEENGAGADGKMAPRGGVASVVGHVAGPASNYPRDKRPTCAAASPSARRPPCSADAAAGHHTHTRNNTRGLEGEASRRGSINIRDLVSNINSTKKNVQQLQHQQSMNLSLSFGTSAIVGGCMDSNNTLNINNNNLNMSSMPFGTAAVSSIGNIGSLGTSHANATSHQTLASACLLLDSNTSSNSHDESDAGMLYFTGIGTAIDTDDHASASVMMEHSHNTSTW
jgi:hypothetical protein